MIVCPPKCKGLEIKEGEFSGCSCFENYGKGLPQECDCPGHVLDVAKTIEKHDQFLQCLIALVMAHGGAVKVHGLQLELAKVARLDFTVDQPFLEMRVKPNTPDGKPVEQSRIMLATSLPKVKP